MRFNLLSQTKHGLMVYNRNDKYIGRSLLEYGEFSEGEVELFAELLDKHDAVIDAGANRKIRVKPRLFLIPLKNPVPTENGGIKSACPPDDRQS